ncbi:MAG: Holliday junction branch migration protein RuvA [Gomphosphaeria aponina SAG 52.96 = DSM 107014]|uniref:Holliday junction branch migration complex subunit RuvA n=1 Tax=Gomphosphaeria aponina SAG 52.96 = DSM 107014 TaxID=1521640 RepID=A0A941GU48_9CHRO|nr:Holliday junction branch migration protein RuvA [Gomphosphaeria aponina SAG 52.96 = DSM 107014]
MVFTHQQIREDQQFLYGFATAAERDLFRGLISVSGIGATSAVALIDTLGFEDLVAAIATSNINALTKTPGVGKKTAERLVLELKSKLDQWRLTPGGSISSALAVPTEILAELEVTLAALGYTKAEIEQAISLLSQDNQMLKNPNVEEWLKKAIAYLST